MGMMRYFHANICSASFSSLSTLHLIGVLISSLEQRGALRRLGGQVCIVFVPTRMAVSLKFDGRKDCRSGTMSHLPYFVTHYVDSMPIASIGGILCDVLFNPKCVYKVTVAIDSLGNIVWICGAVWVT